MFGPTGRLQLDGPNSFPFNDWPKTLPHPTISTQNDASHNITFPTTRRHAVSDERKKKTNTKILFQSIDLGARDY